MEKESILQKLKEGDTFLNVEKIAEKLTYEISLSSKRSNFRARYNFLSLNDFIQMGYDAIWIDGNENSTKKFLLSNGYICSADSRVYSKGKEVVFIGKTTIVSVETYFNKEFTLCLLSEYQELLATKIYDLVQKEKSQKDYILSLIQDKIELLEEIKNQEMVEQIISDAIENAKKVGLLKEKPTTTTKDIDHPIF